MKRFPLRGVRAAAPWALVAALLCAPAAGVYGADAVRPEIGKPLQEAASMIKAGRYREALARVADAEAVSGKTANESYLIERMRFSAAQGAGDLATAGSALDALAATGRSSAAEREPMVLAVAEDYYRAKDYPHAIVWLDRYRKEGGSDPSARTLLVQSYYLNNDCSAVSRELAPAATESGRPPSEEDLQLLANCYHKSNDANGYANAMERLVTYYPKKDYWADLLSRTSGRKGFADRLDLDLDQLKLLTGNLSSASDYMEMAELSLEVGNPGQAKKVMDQGFASKVFGTGPALDRPQRLSELIAKQLKDQVANAPQRDAEAQAAPDGDLMVTLGYAKVSMGNFDAGIAQMEKGIAKDQLKHPDDARLHLGVAYLMANKKAKAREILRSVKGTDGTADVARLWLIYSGTTT